MAARKSGKNAGNPAVDDVTKNLETGKSTSDAERLDTAATAGGAVDVTTPPVNPEPNPPTVETTPAQPAPADDPQPDAPPGPDDIPPGITDLANRISNAQAAPPAESRQQARDRQERDRQSRTTQSPSTKKLGPLGEKVPGAEHLKIHLRQANGAKSLIGIYNINDFASNQNVETFIYQHIKPSKGPGIYEVTLVDAFGREYDAGTVTIDDPVNPTAVETAPGTNSMDLVKTLVSQQQQQLQEALSRLRTTPEKDPVSTLKDIWELQKEVAGGEGDEGKGTLAAIIQSQGQQTQAFMQMFMEMQAKSDDRMATMMAASKGTDPVMLALLTTILEDRKGGGDKMPPMPAPADPVQNLKGMAEIVALLRPEKSDTDNKLLQHLLEERMSPRDLIELVKSGHGTDDFKKAFENWQVMMTAVQTLRQQSEGGVGATSFWDACAALVSNRDFASSMAGVIRAKTSANPQQRVLPQVQQHQQLPPGSDAAMEAEVIDFERRASALRTRRLDLARRRVDAERQLQEESEALQQEIDRNPNQHKPVVAAAPPPIPDQQPGAEEAPVATPGQEAAVQRVQKRTGGRIPPLPPDIAEHLNGLLAATEDGDLVEAMFELLFYLAGLDHWDQFARAVLATIKNNDKKQTIEFLDAFFAGLEEINLTDKSLRDRVLLVFDRHFADIVTHAQSQGAQPPAEPEDEGEEEYDDDEDDELTQGEEENLPPPTG